MYKNSTVGVVIPAYNEAGFVGEVIDTVPAFVDRVYVVDDHSTDGTWAEILEHAEQQNRLAAPRPGEERADDTPEDRPADRERVAATDEEPDETGDQEVIRTDGGGVQRRVVPMRHRTNQGVGGAIKTGYRRALRDGIDVTAVMNGDGQMDPDILDRIIDPVVEGRADYAKGNRLHGLAPSEMPRWRLFGNLLLTLFTKIASGYWDVIDTQNGYTAISSAALERLDLDDVYDSYGFLNAILMRLNAQGMTVADVPMCPQYGAETSGIRYRSFVPNLSLLLLAGFVWRLQAKYADPSFPAVLYPVGAVGVGVGAGGLLGTLVLGTPAVVPWLFLLLGGVLVLISTLCLELYTIQGVEVESSDGGASS
jgi:glycosyltransferase involved in cell wall biosynthesis